MLLRIIGFHVKRAAFLLEVFEKQLMTVAHITIIRHHRLSDKVGIGSVSVV